MGYTFATGSMEFLTVSEGTMTDRSSLAAITTLVFDFDGTLVDSGAIKKAAFMTALGAGVAVDRDVCERAYATHGTINRVRQLALSFTDIYSRTPSAAECDTLAGAYTEYFREHMNEVVLFAGLPEFHVQFGDWYPFMISSNAPQSEIVELCVKLGIAEYFTRVYGYPVAKADALRQILAELEIASESLLYVGDRVEDGMVADSVGVPFLRLDPGFHSPASDEGILRSLAELADVLTHPRLDTATAQ